jgi:hypothetical protein
MVSDLFDFLKFTDILIIKRKTKAFLFKKLCKFFFEKLKIVVEPLKKDHFDDLDESNINFFPIHYSLI